MTVIRLDDHRHDTDFMPLWLEFELVLMKHLGEDYRPNFAPLILNSVGVEGDPSCTE